MCESLDGAATAETRQNAGTVIDRDEPGGVNAPAGTGAAEVMPVSGIVSAARSLHARSTASGTDRIADARTPVNAASAATTIHRLDMAPIVRRQAVLVN
jgi:hypothetical protein